MKELLKLLENEQLKQELEADHAASEEVIEDLTLDYNEMCERVEELEKRIKRDREQYQNRKMQYVKKIIKLNSENQSLYDEVVKFEKENEQLKEDAELVNALELIISDEEYDILDYLQFSISWEEKKAIILSYYRQQKEGN